MKKLELLERYQQKACCRWSKRATYQIWKELRPLLSLAEANDLTIAVAHYAIGEGRDEFDAVCKSIKKKNIE